MANLAVVALTITLLPACATKAVFRRLGAVNCVAEEPIPATEVLWAGRRGQTLLLEVFYPLGPDRPSGRHDLGRGTILMWAADLDDSDSPVRARERTSQELRTQFEAATTVADPAEVEASRSETWVVKTPTPTGGYTLLTGGSRAKERWTVEVPNLPGDRWDLSVGAHLGLVLLVPVAFAWDVVTFPIQSLFD